MRRYNQRLYRVIRPVLRTGSDVEDTMQDTYLAALRNLDQFEGRAQFGTWLMKIGLNVALAACGGACAWSRSTICPRIWDEREAEHGRAGARTPEQKVSK